MLDAYRTALTLFAQAPVIEPAADAARTAADGETGTSGWLIFLLVVALVVLPFVIGSMLATALRMKDSATRFGVVLFALTLGVTPFVLRGEDAIRYGIDLAGGTNLVYQVQFDKAKAEGKEIEDQGRAMDQMVGAVKRRLDPSNVEEITVRQVGSDRIEVIIPGADPETVAAKKAAIVKLGSLEFGILANRVDHLQFIQQAEADPGLTEVRIGDRVARWAEIAWDEQGNPKLEFGGDRDITVRAATDRETSRPKLTDKKTQVYEVLVMQDPPDARVTGRYVTRATSAADENGRPAVNFTFNETGGTKFQTLTSRNRPRTDGSTRDLAILLDGQVHTAPRLQAVISTQGQITGQFTTEEVNELVNVLNAGALEVPINETPLYEFSVGPTLAHDVQEKGVLAIAIAGVAVLVFMLCYYLFAGVVASLCLVFNLILVMGIMSLIDAAFTLPGLAGIVLTIGMAVDANVLIFERIREEQQRGSSLRMSIHNGFGKALSAIVDGNVTTLITAIVLYVIGTDQVRGFAVTLFIGIVASMFTALYFGRLMFDIVERKRWLKSVRMLSIVGRTQWDFLGKKTIAIGASLVLIVGGLTGFAARGNENFDIDFNGGNMVTFEFVQAQDPAFVSAALRAPELQDELKTGLTIEPLWTLDEADAGGKAKKFRLRSMQSEIKVVRHAIDRAFQEPGRELKKVTLDQYRPITSIPREQPADAPPMPREFRGGHRALLKFSSVLPLATVEMQIEDQLELLRVNDQPKYDNPRSLYMLRGTGDAAEEGVETRGEVRRYAEMELLAAPRFDVADLEAALAAIQIEMRNSPIFEEINTFEAAVAAEMKQTAVLAMLASMAAIVAYIWFRFQQISFGLAAVVALVHDVLITLGILALASMIHDTAVGRMLLLEDFRINLPMIAAFLTIVGYSLNDTIVVFDRIREVRGKNPALTPEMINTSLNQTLARTLLTSFTTWIVVAILYAVGGEGIHGFAFCLVVGVLVGTYSTIYIASPVLLWLMNRPGSAVAKSGASQRATAAAR
ncbi:MAG: protein translocase subunit SecD [Planctomycetaceae bacterium]